MLALPNEIAPNQISPNQISGNRRWEFEGLAPTFRPFNLYSELR